MDPTPASANALKTAMPARLFAYTTASFMVGAVFYTVSSLFIHLTAIPGWAGMAALGGFGTAYASLGYGIGKRYMRRKLPPFAAPYGFALLLVSSGIGLTWMKGEMPDTISLALFAACCTLGALVGSHLGIKAGRSA